MKQIILTFAIYCLAIQIGYSQQNNLKHNVNTALILIDIQNDYFEKGAMTLVGSDNAAKNARCILNRFRTDSLTIIHIQHIATYPSATFFLPNTLGAEINDMVKPQGQEKVIVKHYPNSFRETELLSYLKRNNITDLVICGMMTHICIDATVRAANDFGFNIILIGDACATRDLQINGITVKSDDVQNSFLAALNYTYATVVSTTEYLAQ
jgi:nicotinamidase-related amidase